MSIARDIARMATPDQNFRERLIADPKAGIAKDTLATACRRTSQFTPTKIQQMNSIWF